MPSPTLSENPACNPKCRVCHYKGFDYAEQLLRKTRWAEEQLGDWLPVLQKIVQAPEAERLGYRSKSWLRSQVSEGDVSFGMYRAIRVGGEWEKEFVSWNSCPLHIPGLQRLVSNLRQAFRESALGFAEAALVGVWVGSPHVVVVSKTPEIESVKRIDWKKVLTPPFDRVWFHHSPQAGKHVFCHNPIEPVSGSVEGVHPIRAFRQVAQSLLVQARKLAVAHLLESKPARILDLYCGTGELSLSFPRETGWVGIELSSAAVNYANTLAPQGREVHSAFVGAVEQRLVDPRVLSLISAPYALYVNPPRSGLTGDAQEKVLRLIEEQPPSSIAYLSCSASSLARDLPVLEDAGYRIELLQPYDFFPQTEHFETLALLSRK